jgi:hypothetical protein
LNDEHRNFLNFALDTGIGERNSAGLGFLNVEEGARTVQLLMLANEVEIVQY